MGKPRITPKATELLNVIGTFGGYITRQMVQDYFGVSLQFANRLLIELYDDKLLQCLCTYPRVFQITSRGCAFIARKNSYMCRKHSIYTICRKLTAAHFLARQFKPDTLNHLLGFSNDRIAYLRGLEVDDTLIPHKTNKGIAVLQIEEPLIIPPSLLAPDGGICVVHVDQLELPISTQLRTTVGRYAPLIRSKCIPVNFLSAAVSRQRAKHYELEYEKIMSRELIKPKFQSVFNNFSYEHVAKKLEIYNDYI